MYQRIVVGTDGSDRSAAAVDQAARLAQTFGAELHIVQGCGSPVTIAPMFGDVVSIDMRDVTRACAEALEPVADRYRDDGTTVEIHVESSGGAAALCDVAARIDADLIVVGNRGMTGAKRFLGSVPNSVAHQASCSVLIVETG